LLVVVALIGLALAAMVAGAGVDQSQCGSLSAGQ
jgi:hypothetical protein